FQGGYFLLLAPRRLRVAADEYDPSGVLGVALRHAVPPTHRRGADRAANRFAAAAPGRAAILGEVGGRPGPTCPVRNWDWGCRPGTCLASVAGGLRALDGERLIA